MSERGSFCTQYIYCNACFEAAKKVLLGNHKYLCSTAIPSWESSVVEIPIIAGKIGGIGPGDEIIDFEFLYIPKLKRLICHSMRIAVLSESSEETIFKVTPSSS